jgi:hypothetical protein
MATQVPHPQQRRCKPLLSAACRCDQRGMGSPSQVRPRGTSRGSAGRPRAARLTAPRPPPPARTCSRSDAPSGAAPPPAGYGARAPIVRTRRAAGPAAPTGTSAGCPAARPSGPPPPRHRPRRRASPPAPPAARPAREDGRLAVGAAPPSGHARHRGGQIRQCLVKRPGIPARGLKRPPQGRLIRVPGPDAREHQMAVRYGRSPVVLAHITPPVGRALGPTARLECTGSWADTRAQGGQRASGALGSGPIGYGAAQRHPVG